MDTETFAEYILSENDWIKKMEIVYYLQKRTKIFFDNTVIFKTFLAKLFLEKTNLNLDKKILSIKELTLEMLVSLADSNILTLQDLADLSSFELMDVLFAHSLTLEDSESIIMKARSMCMN